jgi:fucose 4-O-acetylase-like acetyltransferase
MQTSRVQPANARPRPLLFPVTTPNSSDDFTKNTSTANQAGYTVIDTIRFIAICSVVWGHCSLGLENNVYHTTTGTILQALSMQAGRAGTILFFIIAGVIWQLKLAKLQWFSFIKSRIKPIIIPWMVAVVVFCVLMFVNTPSVNMWHNYSGIQQPGPNIFATINATLFHTTYWFIIVYLISALVLVLAKKYIYNSFTGMVFGMFTLFYCINLYYRWVSVYHTKAFLGYIFIMWLGVMAGQNFAKLKSFVARVPWAIWIPAFLAATALACFEGYFLTQKGCRDPYASIRLTNIIQAVVLFALLLKKGDIKAVNRLNPRKTTYYIYLIHCMVIYELTMLLNNFFNVAKPGAAGEVILRELAFFTVVLTSSWLLAAGLKQASAKFFPVRGVKQSAVVNG